ncbi:pentatricopeptide repeat-containing protein At3g09650, chloroplastic [Olea europaea var. sylvestris]|uniref:pentatricopeptide repeat-containing protein At3g09650, chloroplastic n=1 Tax=Olea europaea var. sylvestris TaxID=158386 RepID=UPI000C1D08C1|nr:pentatricopeptide repeat-containing protein At3g09650, chloroplastic [Olea europaea var. sylvestris]
MNTTSSPFPSTHNLTLCWVSLPPSSTTLFASATTNSKPPLFRVQTTTNPSNTSLTTTTSKKKFSNSQEQILLTLLQQRKTEEAWLVYTQYADLPGPTCLSRLLSQLSYQNTNEGLTRAQSIIQRLRQERQLHRLDANSLGLLAVAAAKGGHTLYATSIIKSMLKSGYLPHVKSWSAVISRLAGSGDDGPVEAIKLFNSVTRRVRRFADSEMVKHSKPDTGAYNAVLNACANLGDTKKFLQLFDEMPDFGCEPDSLTYNVMIKLCARVERKDLLVFVLERIIEKEIPLCMTTFLIPDEGLLDTLADICVRAAFFRKALEIVACMEEHGIHPNKTKYKRIYVEMHSRMFTSKHASRARQDRRRERKRAAEAFKFWLGLPNSYYGSEWRLDPAYEEHDTESA